MLRSSTLCNQFLISVFQFSCCHIQLFIDFCVLVVHLPQELHLLCEVLQDSCAVTGLILKHKLQLLCYIFVHIQRETPEFSKLKCPCLHWQAADAISNLLGSLPLSWRSGQADKAAPTWRSWVGWCQLPLSVLSAWDCAAVSTDRASRLQHSPYLSTVS